MKRNTSLSILLIMFIACSESKEIRMQRFLLQGNEKIKTQEYEQAEKYFKEAIRLDSCFADAWNNLGTLYYNRKDEARALVYYGKAISCNTLFVQGYLNRANVYYTLDEFDYALKDLKKVEQHTDTVLFHYLKGLVLWKLHHYADAKQSFKRALTKIPTDRDVLINIGTLETSLLNYDSAKAYLNKVLKLYPDTPDACNVLALVEAETGNVPAAHKWIEKALQRHPKNPYYLNNKGYILLLDGKPQKALSFINESIVIDPRNGWAYRNKGLYYLQTNHVEDAIRMLKQAEAMDPFIIRINYVLGEAFARLGEKSLACEHYQKALEQSEIMKEEYTAKCR